MGKLITIQTQQTLITGDYKSATNDYAIQYTYTDGQLKTFRVTITDLNGVFAGNANYDGTSNTIAVKDPTTLPAIADVINSLYAEANANITPAPASDPDPASGTESNATSTTAPDPTADPDPDATTSK
ncbi:MAG: hypothetical protein LKE54_07350 [Prevotella sp.]|jgi:hypothetical protein|nr:hypothetical protein [Prevotella sp.]MCH3994849.1 hypothetical protein [Prevotella sp.]